MVVGVDVEIDVEVDVADADDADEDEEDVDDEDLWSCLRSAAALAAAARRCLTTWILCSSFEL